MTTDTQAAEGALPVYDSARRPHPFLEEAIELWRFRDLVTQWSRRNVKLRYRRSALGVLWTLIEPLVLTIILTALLASIGSAAVPGAGLLMLVIVLESIGVNPAGLALIFAVDRPLDMLRTSVNVTGDALVAMVVAKSVGKLGKPRVKEWDDYYHKQESNQQKS